MSDTSPGSQPEGSLSGEKPREDSTGVCGAPAAEAVSPPAEDQPTVISGRPPLPAFAQAKPAAEPDSGDIPPGARLGHFELLEYVGGGGMGRVFRALDMRLGRTVAVKALSRQQAADVETLMRFRNEARSAARLNHPGIAQVYYVGEEDGVPFIAFEFVEGVNVRDLVAQKGALPLGEALSYTLQVAEALAHAAARKVVHRDIKPSNVLITPEGQAKLIDMGLARMQKIGTSASDLTASGVTLGTFDYISPEQARDPRNADARSDIYSLGCTLFFILTGRPPFPEGTVLQKLLQHQEIDPPDVRQFRPDLPDEVARLLRRMMAKEPRRRYQDLARLIEALLALAEQFGLRARGPGQTAWAEAEAPRGSFLYRHVPWMAPVAALVVIVMVLYVLWGSPAQQTDLSSPYWLSEREELGTDLPKPEESATPGVGPAKETPLPEPAGQPPNAAVTPEAKAPGTGVQKAAATPNGSAPTSAPQGNGSALEKASPDVPVDVADPNPLVAVVSSHSSGPGLRPELLEGSVSLPGQMASGVSAPGEPESEGELSGAAGTAVGPDSAGPLAASPQKGDGVLVVDPDGGGEDAFPTLSAACGAASHGDVIELRFNGRLEEEPLELANVELTIRAAEGFQPVVGFRPSEIDPIGYPRSMFTLIGSRLTVSGVSLEFDVPREVATDAWSLFEIGQPDKVTLAKCLLTIRNAAEGRAAYHQDVAFFRLKAAPGTSVLMQDEPRQPAEPVPIELADTVVRGEAVFLWIEDLQPVDLDWTKGLLVTTEQLLVAEGGERAPQPKEAFQIDLRQVTAVADGGLCRLKHSEFAPYQLPVHAYCANSIFLLTPEASLIEQVGVTDMEQSLERVVWVGERNVYLNFTYFWTIRHLEPGISPEPKAFGDLPTRWNEESPRAGQIDEDKLPGPHRPVHSLAPEDYLPVEQAAEAVSRAIPVPPAEQAGQAKHIGFRVGG